MTVTSMPRGIGLVEGGRHETRNSVDTLVVNYVKLASTVCYLCGLIN